MRNIILKVLCFNLRDGPLPGVLDHRAKPRLYASVLIVYIDLILRASDTGIIILPHGALSVVIVMLIIFNRFAHRGLVGPALLLTVFLLLCQIDRIPRHCGGPVVDQRLVYFAVVRDPHEI